MRDLALVAVTVVWGATFVIVKRALEDASPLLFVGLRFAAATAVLVFLYRRRLASGPIRGGLLAGVFLFAGYAFQTLGLQETSASKAAFITSLNVVLVPFFGALVYRVWPHISESIGVVVATAGLALLTLEGEALAVGRGDMLELICAAGFAAHIVVLGHYSRAGFERVAVLQVATTAALALIGCGLLERPYFRSTTQLWLALAATSLLATALALTVMVWAQQTVPPARAALIFALEPVVAAVTSWLAAGEAFTARAAAGAALILGGILVAELKPVGPRAHPSP
ncbi:MAG: DMT family transporter [Bryobacteraceae bacterium]